jgi:hypothetical protein
MNGLLRSALLTALPHGGQRRARENALAALTATRTTTAERAEAERAFEPYRPDRRIVNR